MSDELTDGQIVELKGDLLVLKANLIQSDEVAKGLAGVVELDQGAVGRLSRIDAIQQQKMAEAQRRRNELRLKQIAVALKTLADEDYGWCKKCGEPIGYRRLKARPESPCCVPCTAELGR
jgi:DnaK suppressor protein